METAPSDTDVLGESGENVDGDCYIPTEACPGPEIYDSDSSACRAKTQDDCNNGVYTAFMEATPDNFNAISESGAYLAADCYDPLDACIGGTKHDGINTCTPKTSEDCTDEMYSAFMEIAPADEGIFGESGQNAHTDCYTPADACVQPEVHDGTSACRPKTIDDCTDYDNYYTAFMLDAPEDSNVFGESGLNIGLDCYQPFAVCTGNMIYNGSDACEPVDQAYCATIDKVFMTVSPMAGTGLENDCQDIEVACVLPEIHDGISACIAGCPEGETYLLSSESCVSDDNLC